jgi:signal transduction histidine kinase
LWLLDAAVALALTLASVRFSSELPPGWWQFSALLVAGLLIQRRWPVLAVVLATIGAAGHYFDSRVGPLPLDLAAPITVYVLASTVRRRRMAVVAVAVLLVGVYLTSFVAEVTAPEVRPGSSVECVLGAEPRPRVDCLPLDKRAALSRGPAAGKPLAPPVPAPPAEPARPIKPASPEQAALARKLAAERPLAPTDGLPVVKPALPGAPEPPAEATGFAWAWQWFTGRLVDAFGNALLPMLILGLALAFGDSVRSRRAHLHTLEQRAADLEREQHQRVALAAAAERARITRELHDVVAHGMSVMVVQAQGGAAALQRHPDRTAAALQNVITTGRASLAEMRCLLGVVSRDPADDPELAPQPGLGSLPALIDQVRAAGTPVHLAIEGRPVPLPASVDLSAYRIVQEALTNTIKYAGGQATATVRLSFEPGWVEVDVSDDGVGERAPGAGGGNGLRGIGERVGMLGGELAVGPGPAGGFRVWALLPLRPAEIPP